jgi:diamine N-acetyltransferase
LSQEPAPRAGAVVGSDDLMSGAELQDHQPIRRTALVRASYASLYENVELSGTPQRIRRRGRACRLVPSSSSRIAMSQLVNLTGQFVDLRPLVPTDSEITLRWRQSARARLLNPGATTVSEQEAWIGSRPDNEYNFIIALKEGQPVGMLSLIGVNTMSRHGETARFLIGQEEAVRGIPAAVEAMKLLYEFAFDTLKLERIFGNVTADNMLMVKWQKYLGMKEEGRMRRHHFINGKFQDAIILGLLVEEYRNESLPRMNGLIRFGSRSTEHSEGV